MPYDAPVRFAGLETRLRTLSLRLDQVQRTGAGPPGPQGPQGDIGPMPKHEWESTRLRFEQEPGVWGKWTDLQGPPGETKVHVVPMGGGGGGYPPQAITVQAVSSFVPTLIKAGETFLIPRDTQAVFATNILVEGILDIEGDLIEVN
jgi:hypothetical protein